MYVCGSVPLLVVASLTWKQSLFLAITGSVFGLFCVTELVVFSVLSCNYALGQHRIIYWTEVYCSLFDGYGVFTCFSFSFSLLALSVNL